MQSAVCSLQSANVIHRLNLVCKFGRMSTNYCFNKDYHFNGSFEDGLKEKLPARYTVVFFPIQSNIFVLL